MKRESSRGISLVRHRKTKMLKMDFASEQWILTASRALVWPRFKTVIVADIHFGKASLFREAGVPVPMGTTSHDLSTLARLIADHAPERLLILGDFFHGLAGDSTLDAITHWRKKHSTLSIEVIRGNHDRPIVSPKIMLFFSAARSLRICRRFMYELT